MKFINDILNRFSKKTTGLMLGDYVNYSGIKDDAKLIDEGFITSADVYSIVSFIAMKSGDLPIDIFTDGEKQDEGNIFDIIYNNELPKEELLNRLNTFQGLTGDNFILKTEVPQFDANMNRVSKMILEPLYPQNVFINIDYSSGAIKNYEYNDGYKIKKYEPEEIIHVKYFDPSINGLTDLRGLSPLQAGYMAMIASNNRSHANASMLKNGGVKGILTGETGGDGLSHALGDNIEKIQEELNKRLGQTGNFNSIYATKSSYKYTPIGMNANDLKIIESQNLAVAANGSMFRTDKEAVLSTILKKWFEERVLYKGRMKKAYKSGDKEAGEYNHLMQYTMKILLNSLYGATALPSFRYGMNQSILSEAITLSGHRIIQESALCANRHMNKVMRGELKLEI